MNLIVIGTSPFSDVTVAAGPFRSYDTAHYATQHLDHKGWNTEIIELVPAIEIGTVANDEAEDE